RRTDRRAEDGDGAHLRARRREPAAAHDLRLGLRRGESQPARDAALLLRDGARRARVRAADARPFEVPDAPRRDLEPGDLGRAAGRRAEDLPRHHGLRRLRVAAVLWAHGGGRGRAAAQATRRAAAVPMSARAVGAARLRRGGARGRRADARERRQPPERADRARDPGGGGSGVLRDATREAECGAMKTVIPGGSGQIGTFLARALVKQGHEVVVLSRSAARSDDAARAPSVDAATKAWRTVTWDGATLGEWARELDGADVLVNLAGRSVNCRYGPKNRASIMDSRVSSTRVLGEAIARAQKPPRVWLQASTATIYCHRYDAPNDEATGILGGDEPGAPDTWNFSIDVAKTWESVFSEVPAPAARPDMRKVALRAAMVMNPERGSTFDLLLALVRFGLGGRAGDG